jgi:hypothetical protein
MIGLIGMVTSYFECALAQLYKNAEPAPTAAARPTTSSAASASGGSPPCSRWPPERPVPARMPAAAR